MCASRGLARSRAARADKSMRGLRKEKSSRSEGTCCRCREGGRLSADALEAVAAVDGLIAARLERHLGRAATAAARRTEHLPRAITALHAPAAAVAAGFAGLPAIRTTIGFVLKALLGVEVLLACSERKLCAAVDAGQQLVGIHGFLLTPLREWWWFSAPGCLRMRRGVEVSSDADVRGKSFRRV
jgi:hypothetical protein